MKMLLQSQRNACPDFLFGGKLQSPLSVGAKKDVHVFFLPDRLGRFTACGRSLVSSHVNESNTLECMFEDLEEHYCWYSGLRCSCVPTDLIGYCSLSSKQGTVVVLDSPH